MKTSYGVSWRFTSPGLVGIHRFVVTLGGVATQFALARPQSLRIQDHWRVFVFTLDLCNNGATINKTLPPRDRVLYWFCRDNEMG
jgi:hypothetical protein